MCFASSRGRSRVLLLSKLPLFPVLLALGSAGAGGLAPAFVTPQGTALLAPTRSDPWGAPAVTAPRRGSPQFTHVSWLPPPGCFSE